MLNLYHTSSYYYDDHHPHHYQGEKCFTAIRCYLSRIISLFASTGTNGLKEANNSDTVNKVYNLFLRNFLHSFGCSFLQTYGLVTFKTPHPFRTKISQLSVEKSLTNYCEVKAVE